MLTTLESRSYLGPEQYALADWRRTINDLYSQIRLMPDPEKAWKVWHGVRSDLYANHMMSPVPEKLQQNFVEIEVFDYDPGMRFYVGLEDAVHETLEYNLGDDGSSSIKRIAKTVGLADDLGAELDVFWIEGYGGGLFIPFKDESSGKETYGGGRYLVDAIKGSDLGLNSDGKLILDFNFSYNPSCSMSEKFVCPLAPPQNRIPVKVLAGERLQSWVE
ncbi:MAG: DUF1684 domain-containing protein [Pseudomonadota bacterium]